MYSRKVNQVRGIVIWAKIFSTQSTRLRDAIFSSELQCCTLQRPGTVVGLEIVFPSIKLRHSVHSGRPSQIATVPQLASPVMFATDTTRMKMWAKTTRVLRRCGLKSRASHHNLRVSWDGGYGKCLWHGEVHDFIGWGTVGELMSYVTC